mgnify:CR=1 FL=1
MKHISLAIVTFLALSISAHAKTKIVHDIRASQSFLDTCPEKYLTYMDKSEGGPGAYCACPEDQISYLDKSEGGTGAYCQAPQEVQVKTINLKTGEVYLVLDVLSTADAQHVAGFLKSGNTTMSATMEKNGSDTTVYKLTRQQCFTNGTSPAQCLGGSVLTVNVKEQIMMGNIIKKGESRLDLIK